MEEIVALQKMVENLIAKQEEQDKEIKHLKSELLKCTSGLATELGELKFILAERYGLETRE